MALNRYCEDGNLSIDNNATERDIRGVAVGRNNWMFFGSDQGGNQIQVPGAEPQPIRPSQEPQAERQGHAGARTRASSFRMAWSPRAKPVIMKDTMSRCAQRTGFIICIWVARPSASTCVTRVTSVSGNLSIVLPVSINRSPSRNSLSRWSRWRWVDVCSSTFANASAASRFFVSNRPVVGRRPLHPLPLPRVSLQRPLVLGEFLCHFFDGPVGAHLEILPGVFVSPRSFAEAARPDRFPVCHGSRWLRRRLRRPADARCLAR